MNTVMITGAAKGLGRALSELFAAEGWTVFATDQDLERLTGLPQNSLIHPCAMDVTSDHSVSSTFQIVSKQTLTLDLIINNAGIDRYFPLSEASVDAFKLLFDVNVFGGYRVNQTFLPILKKPGGKIFHISSESLNLTVPFMPYPLSKRLVEGYAKVLRQELKFRGVDVVIVRPGAIQTDLLNQVKELDLTGNIWQLAKPFQRFAESAPREIGRVITPEKAARFIFRLTALRHPKAVYRINNTLQLRIASRIPFQWMEKIVYKHLS